MVRKTPRLASFVLAACIIATSWTPLLPATAHAVGTHPADTAHSKALYNALRACVAYEQGNQSGNAPFTRWISINDAKKNNWWAGPGAVMVSATFRDPSFLSNVFEDGRQTCNVILSEGLKLWGFNDGLELLCAANIQRKDNGGSCQNGTGDSFDIGADDEPAIAEAIRRKAFGGADITGYTVPEHYTIYQAAFLKGCKVTAADTGSGDRDYTDISIVNTDGTITKTRFEGRQKGDKVYVYTLTNMNSVQEDCGTIAQSLNGYASGYSEWIIKNPDAVPETPIDDITDPATGDDAPTCTVEGIGWIVCPVTTFLAGLNQNMFNFISGFLQIPASLFADNTGTVSTKSAWETFRGFANILFIIAFLIIVYSQVTSVGITNYGVKKLLPKLIIAAILVNTSYYICMLAVDISNILGYGIQSLFHAIGGGLEASSTAAAPESDYGWATVMVAILATSTAIVLGLLAISVPVLLAGLLALAMTALILVARQALVILLVVISPIAFVLYLLPNTEKWFKKWWDLFFAMLILFPAVSLLFGAGSLASQILRNTSEPDVTSTAYWFPRIAALAASVLPLFALIPIVQNSMKATGALGAKLSGWSGKANARIGSKVKDTTMAGALQKQYTRQRNIKRAQILGGQKGVGGFINRRINRMTGSLGKGIAATGASTALKMRNEDVENAVAQMQSQWQPHEELDKAEEAYAEALKKGDVTKARAAQKILLSKGGAGVARIRKTIEAGERTGSLHADAANAVKSDLAGAGLKGKDAGLNTWSYDTRSLSAIDGDKDTYDKLTDEELSTQTSLDRAHRAGALGGGRANRILGNKDLHGNLTQDKFDVLGRAASGSPPPTPPAPPTPSDARLKKDITYIGTNDLGLKLYKFRYSSGSQFYVGVMAQDIILTHPHAVSVGPDGYYRVDYSALGIQMTAID